MKKGYFTGYPEGVKGFKVWMPEERKVIISRDVVFREEVVYKDDKNGVTSQEVIREETPNLVSLELSDSQHKDVDKSEG